jgi:hypothetical protein
VEAFIDTFRLKYSEMKKKQGRPRAKDRFRIYSIEIMDYEPSYSISVDPLKDINPEPISERAELKMTGKLLAPSNVAGKILSVRIIGSRKTSMQCSTRMKYRWTLIK